MGVRKGGILCAILFMIIASVSSFHLLAPWSTLESNVSKCLGLRGYWISLIDLPSFHDFISILVLESLSMHVFGCY